MKIKKIPYILKNEKSEEWKKKRKGKKEVGGKKKKRKGKIDRMQWLA